MEIVHKYNIVIHIITGCIALALGLVALLSTKGGKLHNTSGKYFLRLIAFVILTGLIGVFVFKRNSFLLVITVLSGYVSFSGYRVLVLKSNTLKSIDVLVAMASLLVLAYFLYYFKSIGMIWSPVIIYSGAGALLVVVMYDFLRYLIPKKKYEKNRIWLYEHVYKMTSAFSGLLAAFVGTVFDQYQPHSQYIPSVLGMMIIFGFMIYVYKYGLKKDLKSSRSSSTKKPDSN
ncbi:hypothetical protein [Spongiivirga citrea]|uniref:DUF2306 domain-containing protein n=1 Tax=Spongiivirga citrea TaxID=1481457 RepID=A0A6M0CLE0_9FLAO|nr:hypothetical protein [Spongiivirga citrea]NER18472.1 hypothetical protein [Spongiivirga citrea]